MPDAPKPSNPTPANRPAAPRAPAARPAGVRRMDFVARRPAVKPAGATRLHPNPQATPVQRPAARPATTSAPRPATKPAQKPVAAKPAPTRKPTPAPRPVAKPVPNPRAKKPAEPEFGIIEEYHSVEIEATTITQAKATSLPPEATKEQPAKAPRNWPFLASVNVDKRPLSANKKPTTQKVAKPTPQPVVSSVVLNSISTGKKSKAPLIILLIITILLGIAVGAAVYFCIFGI